MFTILGYTIFWVICILLTLAAAAGLVATTKKFTEEKSGYKQGSDWFRFIIPTVLALFLAYWTGMGGMWNWVYILLIGVGLPLALTFFFNRDQIEKKNDRILALVALLLFLQAAFFTAAWTYHYRGAHATDLDDNAENDDENPHLSARNWFLIPLWVLTAIVGAVAGHTWKKNNQKEGDTGMNFLPF